jgi:hypothetical protein
MAFFVDFALFFRTIRRSVAVRYGTEDTAEYGALINMDKNGLSIVHKFVFDIDSLKAFLV